MKGDTEMRLWKRSLGLDAQRNITATYTEEGTILARMWPTHRENRSTTARPRFLLICDSNQSIEEGDKIEVGEKRYRTLWVKLFPKHCEVVVEEEET